MIRRLRFTLMYFRRPPWDSGMPPPELCEFMATHPPGRAIDLGCGTGTNVVNLAQNGWQVTGVDFIPKAIRSSKRKIKLAGIRADLRVGDVTNLRGITGPFDLALDMGCFHGLNDKPAYLKELDRILAPGGHWLMYGFFKPDPHRAGRFEFAQHKPGLAAPDLDLIAAQGLTLLSRTDGFDKKERSSAWFLFQKPPS
jgi:ubiquinone/menaquinone biosynthesis C-methylase UbiE